MLNQILFLWYKNPTDEILLKLFNSLSGYSVKKISHELQNIYSAMLGIEIEDLTNDECLIKWVISDYQAKFIAPEPDKLI